VRGRCGQSVICVSHNQFDEPATKYPMPHDM